MSEVPREVVLPEGKDSRMSGKAGKPLRRVFAPSSFSHDVGGARTGNLVVKAEMPECLHGIPIYCNGIQELELVRMASS